LQNSRQSYYDGLSREYATSIRQLVPRYDEMLEHVAGWIDAGHTATLLDLGTGTGEASLRALRAVPALQVTAVDAAPEMARAAGERLAEYGERARVVAADITRFEPDRCFDAILSSIALHNLPPRAKRRMLRIIHGWLEPGGRFIWADFIRAAEAAEMQRLQHERIEFAQSHGCERALIESNFAKEATDDWPWTVLETLLAARRAGFRDVDCTWRHSAFAVFVMRRRGAHNPAERERRTGTADAGPAGDD